MTALQTIIVISCLFIFLSITRLFKYARHQSKKVRSLLMDPPTEEYADMHQEIWLHNKYNNRWIIASPVVYLARPSETYDLWMPR